MTLLVLLAVLLASVALAPTLAQEDPGLPEGEQAPASAAAVAQDPDFSTVDDPLNGDYELFTVDDLLIIRGVNVYPTAVENIVRQFPEVGEFAVDVHRRDALDEMEIRLEVSGGRPQAACAAVAQAMRDALGLRVDVQPVAFGTLPRFDLKAKRFRDHRGRE